MSVPFIFWPHSIQLNLLSALFLFMWHCPFLLNSWNLIIQFFLHVFKDFNEKTETKQKMAFWKTIIKSWPLVFLFICCNNFALEYSFNAYSLLNKCNQKIEFPNIECIQGRLGSDTQWMQCWCDSMSVYGSRRALVSYMSWLTVHKHKHPFLQAPDSVSFWPVEN